MKSYLSDNATKQPQRNAGSNFRVTRMFPVNIFPWRSYEILPCNIAYFVITCKKLGVYQEIHDFFLRLPVATMFGV